MKKYEKMTQDLLNDEKLIVFLSEQAKDGWMVKKINYSYITFVKCEPIHLKFDIDYVEVTHEYQEITKEQGYKHICFFDGKHIYANEDLQAIDLYNDEETKQMAYLNYYKISKILHHLLWVGIFITNIYLDYNQMFYRFYRHSFALFLTKSFDYLILFLYSVLLILHICSMCHMIYMRSYYKKKENKEVLKIEYLKFFNNIEIMILNILVSILPFILTYSFMENTHFVRLSIILGLFIFTVLIVFETTYKSKYKLIINSIVMICAALICLKIYDYTSISLPVNTLYYEDQVEDYFIDYYNDLFSHSRMIYIFNDDYYEKCVVSVNENISKEIFKEEVIILECYSRNAVGKEDYLTYEEAIKKMKIINNDSIDEGYYNDKYAIIRKDQQVISFMINDSIDRLIEYYYK